MKFLGVIFFIIPLFSCTSSDVKIGKYENPQRALLVIDMQEDYIGEHAKLPIEQNQIENLIITVNKIIEEFHMDGYEIIYLRNIFRENDIKNIFRNYAAIEGTRGIEIDPRIKIVSENIFDKYSPSAFSNSDFENYLIQHQINELYVCGVMADQCVFETAADAFNKNYKVNYFADAVGSTSTKNIEKAEKKLSRKGINIVKAQGT